jgi:hypothetical protein
MKKKLSARQKPCGSKAYRGAMRFVESWGKLDDGDEKMNF